MHIYTYTNKIPGIVEQNDILKHVLLNNNSFYCFLYKWVQSY